MKQLTTQEIQAILDGRKTQFREAIEYGLYAIENDMNDHSIEIAKNYCDLDEQNFPSLKPEMIKHSKHQIGDTLWKDTEHESVVTNVRAERLQDIIYQDIVEEGLFKDEYLDIYDTGWTKHKAINSELNNEEFKTMQEWFLYKWVNYWNSTAKDGYKWEDNPYVFVYEFKRIEK